MRAAGGIVCPYSESKEYLGGFWIIEADDLDEALDWARRGSKACRGRIEVHFKTRHILGAETLCNHPSGSRAVAWPGG
ncbi:MAG: YciI family protein [Propionibacteriaceae bacterium]